MPWSSRTRWSSPTDCWQTGQAGTGNAIPGFVYGILVSLFVLFNCFAVVQYLQYRRIGRWRDYLYGEWTYIVLSLIAKSALAWQIFAGTLIPPE